MRSLLILGTIEPMSGNVKYTRLRDEQRIRIPGTDYSVAPAVAAQLGPDVLATSNTVEILLRYVEDAEDWDVWSIGVIRDEGEPPISSDALREIAPTAAIRAALHGVPDLVVHGPDVPVDEYWEGLRPGLVARRADGPTSENLSVLSDVYRVAGVLRRPQVMTAARMFDIPGRTATHWVKLARERGHLRGRDGAAADSAQ